uniref:Protein TsetseEP domain-containing protein n=1 Tax=Clastoptera arizonana TaxID=38151 RepID=A0A1B6CA00_9HEMI
MYKAALFVIIAIHSIQAHDPDFHYTFTREYFTNLRWVYLPRIPDATRGSTLTEIPVSSYINSIIWMLEGPEAINAKECYLGMKETFNNYKAEVERIYAACVAKSDNSSMENLSRLITTLQANLVQLDQETYDKEQACVDETCRNTTLQDGLQIVKRLEKIHFSKFQYLCDLCIYHYPAIVKKCFSFATLDLLEDILQRFYELKSCLDKYKS